MSAPPPPALSQVSGSIQRKEKPALSWGAGRCQHTHLESLSPHLNSTAPPTGQWQQQHPEFCRGGGAASGPLRTSGACRKWLSVGGPVPHAVPSNLLSSQMGTRWPTRTGGHRPGLDLAASQAPAVRTSPSFPRAPSGFRSRAPSAAVWAVRGEEPVSGNRHAGGRVGGMPGPFGAEGEESLVQETARRHAAPRSTRLGTGLHPLGLQPGARGHFQR